MCFRSRRSPRVRVVSVVILAGLLNAAGGTKGDVQPTGDRSAPQVDTEQGVRFTLARAEVDGVEVSSVRYRVEVRFSGAREHTLALFIWVDAEGGGRWERRAFYNSQLQGETVVATPTLPAGRKLLLVAWYKDGTLPEDAGEWKQAKLGESAVSKVTDEKPHPDVAAEFGDGKARFVKVKLRPLTDVGQKGQTAAREQK
jgi:hypothetical protein